MTEEKEWRGLWLIVRHTFQPGLFIIILLFGFMLRVHWFSTEDGFYQDQARDAIIVRNNIYNNTPLPEIDSFLGRLKQPADYYYLFIVPGKIFRIPPSAIPYFMNTVVVILHLAAGIFVFFAARNYWNIKTAYVVLVLYTFGNFYKLTSHAWNPNTIPFFIALIVFFLSLYLKNRKTLFLLGIGVAFILGIRIHLMTLLSFPLIILILLFSLRKNTLMQDMAHVSVLIMMLGGYMYMYLTTGNRLQIIQEHSGSKFLLSTIQQENFRNILSSTLGMISEFSIAKNYQLFVWIGLLSFLILVIFRGGRLAKSLSVYIYLMIVAFFLLAGKIPLYEYYFLPLFVPIALMLGATSQLLAATYWKVIFYSLLMVMLIPNLTWSSRSDVRSKYIAVAKFATRAKQPINALRACGHGEEPMNIFLNAEGFRYFFELYGVRYTKLDNVDSAKTTLLVCDDESCCSDHDLSVVEKFTGPFSVVQQHSVADVKILELGRQQ